MLKSVVNQKINNIIPNQNLPNLKDTKTLVFNYYNLDPDWHKNENVQKVLLIEPSFFEKVGTF